MKLGTPLSDTAVRVMLLGSGELGKEVAIELQRLGVEVIAVDRYPNAPAMQVAHRSHVIPMTDPQVLNGVILAEAPHIIVPEIEAIATEVLADIEAAGLAVVIPTARAVQLTMNREGIRRLAAEELGLPTSPYAFAGSAEELAAGAETVGYPCFVKPVMSSSGKGQSFVESPDEIADAWTYAQDSGRVAGARVIVEGRIDFDFEITLLTVRSRAADGSTRTDFCAPIGHRQVKGDYVESWQPQAMSPAALAASQDIAGKVTEALGGPDNKGWGVFGVELFVKGDQVWFSEVSPRPHDTGLVTLASQTLSEFALHARAILGLPIDVTQREPAASAVIYGGLEAQGVAFEGVADALSVPTADLRLFGKPEAFERRRMGVAVARGADVDQARERAREAAGCVKVVRG
ncbi:MAG: formate-dependent phosphoribosylglycinamide formyltransferase [Alphaproteobacteria bacterium]|uniref:formate-dependent phosphoribosylglycinamide formyltransferase n=1 Tax=Brevundimonas sp. TaxID=1871086 RepID=UPI003567BE0B|nr:formate-dependent phosphoribosylglycinamide formyltransferase [Alphaproteobacteria bacterium]MBU1521347.1 formate-dependent phosphoribosylglycinamide formyltransferase [Alphaproteobacteria bacterium]MBU2030041.1 formate-dependent phosphoribosylglycinamide formyltransferase [Alphaproteobacteria bacterium]MBU2163681.1 formate-dependent phosphoribosylglycinamide formyltransferase [Alphaproteobacteria bacterium]MBU2232063.1 formate-dependent phosphoribosylglycinamide formyltransferase [Alphaprot